MPEFIKNTYWMTFFWVGCAVMGIVYLLGVWDGQGSAAFIVGQIVLGIVGVAREFYIKSQNAD